MAERIADSSSPVKSQSTTAFVGHSSQKEIVSEWQSKQCRICLSGASSVENAFLSPCLCSGSVRYVHYVCLKRWCELKLGEEGEKLGRQKVVCELCRQQIKAEVSNCSELMDCSQIAQSISQNMAVFLIILLILALCITMVVLSAVWLGKNTFSGTSSGPLLVCMLVTSACLFAAMLYRLSSFFLKPRLNIQFLNSA